MNPYDEPDQVPEQAAGVSSDAGPQDGSPTVSQLDTTADDDTAAPPAVVFEFGYLPGFAAGVQAGYREGRRDLERAKSDAAGDGFARGVRAAEQFPPARPEQMSRTELICYSMAAGLVFGAWLEQRKQRRDGAEQEGAGYELPDVRS